jgi:Icc-related predicted phosphoesterase
MEASIAAATLTATLQSPEFDADEANALRLLVAGDLHGSQTGADWLLETAVLQQPDVLLFLGDFVTGGPGSFIREYLRALRLVATNCLVVPGNWDPRDAPALIDAECMDGLRNLHKASAYVGGLIFAGLGGSVATPSGRSPLEYPDEGFADPLVPLLPADVWVLHNPCMGFCDRIAGGAHAGSQSLRTLWEEAPLKPRLVVSGHIHDDPGTVEAGPTLFLNPGPLSGLHAAIVTVDKNGVTHTMLKGGER